MAVFSGSRKKTYILGGLLAVAGVLTIALFVGGMLLDATAGFGKDAPALKTSDSGSLLEKYKTGSQIKGGSSQNPPKSKNISGSGVAGVSGPGSSSADGGDTVIETAGNSTTDSGGADNSPAGSGSADNGGSGNSPAGGGGSDSGNEANNSPGGGGADNGSPGSSPAGGSGTDSGNAGSGSDSSSNSGSGTSGGGSSGSGYSPYRIKSACFGNATGHCYNDGNWPWQR